jgi:hypothetical protein
MPKIVSLAAVAAALLVATTSVPTLALPLSGLQPSIPGLESSITKRINAGVSRGLVSPMQANNLLNRLARIESREQMLISNGRFNGLERARVAQELESLSAQLHFDSSTTRALHPWR